MHPGRLHCFHPTRWCMCRYFAQRLLQWSRGSPVRRSTQAGLQRTGCKNAQRKRRGRCAKRKKQQNEDNVAFQDIPRPSGRIYISPDRADGTTSHFRISPDRADGTRQGARFVILLLVSKLCLTVTSTPAHRRATLTVL